MDTVKLKADLLKEIEDVFPGNATRYQIIRHLAETVIADEPYYNLTDFIETYNNALIHRITGDMMDISEAHERIGYVKSYLDGKMYKTPEEEAKNKPIQLRNAMIAFDKTKVKF